MPTEIEKAYAAGLMDGEGHIAITLAKYRPNGEYRTQVVIVTFANTDMAVVRWFSDLWLGGTTLIRNQPCQKVPMAYLRYSSAAAISVLRDLRPYLRIKARQTALALEFADQMAARSRQRQPITEEEWNRREELRLAIRQINRPDPSLKPEPFPGDRYVRKCAHCGATFNRAGSSRIYCTLKCQQTARRVRERKTPA